MKSTVRKPMLVFCVLGAILAIFFALMSLGLLQTAFVANAGAVIISHILETLTISVAVISAFK